MSAISPLMDSNCPSPSIMVTLNPRVVYTATTALTCLRIVLSSYISSFPVVPNLMYLEMVIRNGIFTKMNNRSADSVTC